MIKKVVGNQIVKIIQEGVKLKKSINRTKFWSKVAFQFDYFFFRKKCC